MAAVITDARAVCIALAALLTLAPPGTAQELSAASPSIQHVAAPSAARPSEPQSCASDYHRRLSGIAQTELAAFRAAGSAIGGVDPRLPGRLVFESPRRSDLSEAARRAVEAGGVLARRQGRTSFARDANTKWIAERIREDLTDYLTQKPTPFLCAGAANYLSTLRDYAAQGADSPARLAEHLEAHRSTASAGLDAAFAAMRAAPLPHFAPADRPGLLSVDGLRIALDPTNGAPAPSAEPTRFADRAASRISDSRIDPDLPPLAAPALRALGSDADLLRAVTALLGTAERTGFLAGAAIGGVQEGSARPVLARLVAVRRHLSSPQGQIADPLVRPAIERALSDLEILDYLRSASQGAADPVGTAMHATIDAIEAAHAQSCTCVD